MSMRLIPPLISPLISLLIFLLLLAAPAAAQSQSAADSYRVAAKSLPTAKNEAEEHILNNVFDAPLDEYAKALVQRAEKSMTMFDVASQFPFGTWGFDLNEPMTAGRLLIDAPALADLVVLRAQLSAAAGQHQALLEDAYKLALLSRRMSVQPSLPRQIQQNTIFDKASQLAGVGMIEAAPAEVAAFLEKIEQLRSPADPIDVIEAEERAYLAYHRQLVEDPYLRRIAGEGIGPFTSLFGPRIQPVDVTDLLIDNTASYIAFAETERAFSDAIAALKLPPGDRASEMQLAHSRARSGHAMARTAMQIIDECLRLSQLQEMQVEMLRAACAICADPQRPIDMAKAKALAPRFELQSLEHGFVLRWSDQGQLRPPMTLQVGSRPTRAAPTMRQSATAP